MPLAGGVTGGGVTGAGPGVTGAGTGTPGGTATPSAWSHEDFHV